MEKARNSEKYTFDRLDEIMLGKNWRRKDVKKRVYTTQNVPHEASHQHREKTVCSSSLLLLVRTGRLEKSKRFHASVSHFLHVKSFVRAIITKHFFECLRNSYEKKSIFCGKFGLYRRRKNMPRVSASFLMLWFSQCNHSTCIANWYVYLYT